MKSFIFQNPTKVVFGIGTTAQLGFYARNIGKRALLVFGRDSIKKNGLYQNVIAQLKLNDIYFVEHGGVKSNPVLSHVHDGILKAQSHNIDFIVAVGGGSVIDEAKAIAAGALVKHDVWDFFIQKEKITKALPLISLLTIPATGSEMNGNLVITNSKTQDKLGLSSPFLYPKVSILDPDLTITIPKKYLVASAVDIISHLTESYFNNNGGWTPIQERFVEGMVKTVIEATDKILIDAKDMEARSVFMWAATLSWNGLNTAGLGDFSMPCHGLEHPVSALYDIPHGLGLAIITPAWLNARLDVLTPKIARFGREVFGINDTLDITAARKAIDLLKIWFVKIGAPITFREGGIDTPDIAKLTELTLNGAKIKGTPGLTREFVEQIYISCI